MRQQVAPLSGSMMIIGMFGFLIATMFLKNYSLNWAFILATVSIIIFVASIISAIKSPVEEELALDEHTSERKKRVKIYSLKEYKAHELLMKEKHKRELEALKKAKPDVDKKKTTKSSSKKKSKKSTKNKKKK